MSGGVLKRYLDYFYFLPFGDLFFVILLTNIKYNDRRILAHVITHKTKGCFHFMFLKRKKGYVNINMTKSEHNTAVIENCY